MNVEGTDLQVWEIHPFTLNFTGASRACEAEFRRVYPTYAIEPLRFLIYTAAFLVIGFGILDCYLVPEAKTALLVMAGVIALVILGLGLPFVYLPALKEHLPRGIFLVSSVTCALELVKAYVAPVEWFWYYQGLAIITLFCFYTSTRTRFVPAVLTGWLLSIVHLYIIQHVLAIVDPQRLAIIASIVGGNVVGMLACYGIERYARKEFLLIRLLQTEQTNIEAANAALEGKIQTRTAELVRLNENLREQILERLRVEDDLEQSRYELEMRVNARTLELKSANVNLLEQVEERKRAEERLKYLATHDPLTDLPNRSLLEDRLQHALLRARRTEQMVAVMFLDLDGFKPVNDAFGHRSGDALLQALAGRLTAMMRASDTIARIGGDEFAILLEGINQPDDVRPLAEKVIQTVSIPFPVVHSSGQTEAFITGSVGIGVFPLHGETAEVLLQNADAAMYSAKEAGKNKYAFYSAEIGDRVIQRLDLTNQLRHAIERREFILHYQPQVNALSGEIIGTEALIRWQHPEAGIIPPVDFIPMAEESGLIIPIGEWVLRTACEQSVRWQKAGLNPGRMSVNISSRQIEYQNLVEVVHRTIHETGMDPGLLELELTENTVFQNADSALQWLIELKSLGIHLALDDFGTGYSSLSYLARFPFDIIKIDLEFVRAVTKDPGVVAIVSGIIAIAESLGKEIIVEGVDTAEQLQFFRRQGCNHVQGWFFSPALPAGKLEKLLKTGFTAGETGDAGMENADAAG